MVIRLGLVCACAFLCASAMPQALATHPKDPSQARLPRCADFRVNGQVTLELLAGSFTAPVSGRLRLGLADPDVATLPGLVGVSVGHTRLVAPAWTPGSNLLPAPVMLLANHPGGGTGAWDPQSGVISLALHLSTSDGALPVPMPIQLTGSVQARHLILQGENGNIPDGTIRLTLSGVEARCEAQSFYSTEIGFTSAAYPGGFLPVSHGDLLNDLFCLLRTNFQLT
jgi:hypothetical protein